MSNYDGPRMSVKEASFLSTRESMTKRRQEITNKIRKDKKSQQLALKRRYVKAVDAVEDAQLSIVDAANQTFQNPTLESLSALQAALSTSADKATLPPHNSASSTPQKSLNPEDVGDSDKLVVILITLLTDPSPHLQLISARILTNLAAMEPSREAETSYYGHAPNTWSNLMLRSGFVGAVQTVLSVTTQERELIPQCCWALGNLVADSQEARVAAMPLLPYLVDLIKRSQQSDPWLCRNAAWALSNLARGGSSQAFCGPSLMTPSLLGQLLMSPERVKSALPAVPWWDVAHEVAWVIVFLTAKEDETVNYLCLATPHSFSAQPSVQILEALGCRLAHVAQTLRTAGALSSSEATQAIRMGVPCVRAIGNIASACQGKHLTYILRAHAGSIVKSIATLLELGTYPSSHVVAVEASWAARTLLCDAGLPNHESTDIAVPALLMPLCNCVTSGYSKSELKREAISALWTTVAAPPHADQSMGAVWATRTTRDDFLRQIARQPKMLLTLVDLLRSSMDTEIILTTVQLVNAILRRGDESMRIEFQQQGGVNALEHVCDVASAQCSYGSGMDWGTSEVPAADIAADLIDDIFDSSKEEEMEIQNIAPEIKGATFSFGMPSTTSVAEVEMMPSAGRGRGRAVPAWMTKS